MKTAVEWLVHELGLNCTTDHEDEIHEALEMENEQIEQAYFDGTEFETNGFECNPNRYYNQTFKQ